MHDTNFIFFILEYIFIQNFDFYPFFSYMILLCNDAILKTYSLDRYRRLY